jgi:hypothetical protein
MPLLPASTILTLEIAITEIIIIPMMTGMIILTMELDSPEPSSGSPSGVIYDYDCKAYPAFLVVEIQDYLAIL